MKVLVTSRLFGTVDPEPIRQLEAHGFMVVYHPDRGVPLTAPALLAHRALLQDADAIVCGDDEISEAVLDQAPRLRVICKHGVGVDKIALAAARARGIVVCNAPASNAVAVAEFTLALILALLRRLPWIVQEVLQGRFPAVVGRQLSDCTVGVVGLGHIGRAVAERLRALGCAVLVHDPYVPNLTAWGTPVALPVLWQASDVVTFHVPLTPETKRMVNATVLTRLKPDALLINTARGGLFDLDAVQAWLDAHPEAGVAMDTFDTEPPPRLPLQGPNVLLTSHVAGLTRSFFRQAGEMTAQALIAVAEGRVPPTAVEGEEV